MTFGCKGWMARASRTVLVVPSSFTLMACLQGYPTNDVPQVNPANMSQPQLLAALNDIGKEPHPRRWRYFMHAGCELEIQVRDDDPGRRRVVLQGATISIRSADGVSAIRLVPRTNGENLAVTALETRRWTDTVRARALLTQLELRCDKPEVPAASPRRPALVGVAAEAHEASRRSTRQPLRADGLTRRLAAQGFLS